MTLLEKNNPACENLAENWKDEVRTWMWIQRAIQTETTTKDKKREITDLHGKIVKMSLYYFIRTYFHTLYRCYIEGT